MNEISMEKQKLREEYLEIRKSILNKINKSEIITNKVIEEVEYKNAKVIAIYKSFGTEVDTDNLIEYSIKLEKAIALPRVINNELKFYKIKSLQESFIKSKFGVEEPIENEANYIEKANIDLVIVPGLLFDKENNRLGYGKGYYDRFLEKGEFETIGICFDEQILPQIPITENDIKIKKVITDKRIIN